MKGSIVRARRDSGLGVLTFAMCVTLTVAGFVAHRLFAEETRQAHAFLEEGRRALSQGDRAAATLAFERARWLAPRAHAVRSAVAASGVKDAESVLPRSMRLVTAREWSLLATSCGWISGLGIVFVVARRRSRAARWVTLAAGGVFVLGMAAMVESSQSSPAIVKTDEARVLVAPYEGAAPVGSLPAGTMVLIGPPYDDFVEVEESDGTRGWVPRASVESIARPKS